MLESAAREHRYAIVVGHHPLATKGAHSGFVDPWTHLFPALIGAAYVPSYVEWMPMPIIGSIVVVVEYAGADREPIEAYSMFLTQPEPAAPEHAEPLEW